MGPYGLKKKSIHIRVLIIIFQRKILPIALKFPTIPCLHPLCPLWTPTSRTAELAPKTGRCLWGRGRTACDHRGGDGGFPSGSGAAASCTAGMISLKADGGQQQMTGMQKWTDSRFISLPIFNSLRSLSGSTCKITAALVIPSSGSNISANSHYEVNGQCNLLSRFAPRRFFQHSSGCCNPAPHMRD